MFMNELTFSFLLIPVLLFHFYTNRTRSRLSHKEKQAAMWFADTIYAVCGALGYFASRKYPPSAGFSFLHVVILIFYLLLFLLLLFAAPYGSRLFARNREKDLSALPDAEFRFDSIMGKLRNFIFVLLLCLIPFLFFFSGLISGLIDTAFLASSVFTVCFLLLPPLCLRQAFFWSRVIRITA